MPIDADKPVNAGRLLQLEAALFMLAARFLLRWLPFQQIAKMLAHTTSQAELSGAQRRLVRAQVKSAIFQVWQRFPATNTCFHRALAARWMLSRRRVLTTLYYGARTCEQRGLTGHVWLMDGKFGIVGLDAAKDYAVLAHYPRTQ